MTKWHDAWSFASPVNLKQASGNWDSDSIFGPEMLPSPLFSPFPLWSRPAAVENN